MEKIFKIPDMPAAAAYLIAYAISSIVLADRKLFQKWSRPFNSEIYIRI
jgi:hypothetical protein